MKIFYKIAFLILIIPLRAHASCDFKKAEYITELNKPNNIKEIDIHIPNSRKYFKELLSFKLYNPINIKNIKKKKYNAIINTKYEFGSCISKGKVWQNGDKMDHIRDYVRSLNVRLDNGNIYNATKFKLLIPETRNSRDEILGTLILRELGIISPETFEVVIKVNGIRSRMLFQEDSRKELLERNQRTEGPIFEGDESLFWGYDKYKIGELENISLSRMINKNWFLKNNSSEVISLNSFYKLQNAYLKYTFEMQEKNKNIILPNKKENDLFTDYYFLMISMNGSHGLRPHNRKYYYNSFIQNFEPIYYDGNLFLIGDYDFEENNYQKIIKKAFHHNYQFKHLSRLSESSFKKKIIKGFKDRVITFNNNDLLWIRSRIKSVYKRAENLQNLINLTSKDDYLPNKYDYRLYRKKYLEALNSYDLKQKNINKILKLNNKYLINNNLKISKTEMSNIISRNKFNQKRYLFIPEFYELKNNRNSMIINLPAYNLYAQIYYSDGIKININKNKKEIIIKQSNPKDWVLFEESKIDDWQIYFRGIETKENSILSSRFNDKGLTGCLSFYKTEFENTSISAYDGQCEDTLNLVNSSGFIKKLLIKRGFSDALDVDFSNINMKEINVYKSKNDCIDLSSGNYNINNAYLEECGDKAISIGEKSNFKINNVEINKALIGLSVKDLTLAEVNNALIYNSKVCLESKKKKQEFGGGKVILGLINCDGKYIKDKYSVIQNLNHDI